VNTIPLSPLQQKIFRTLKGIGKPLSLSALSFSMNSPEREVLPALAELILQGWISEKEGKYWIPYFLDPPLKKADLEKKVGEAWNYQEISLELLAGEKPEQAEPFKQPFEKYLPHGWSQNGRGTCTGHAGAIQMQMNYYAVTGDFPTEEEMKEAKANLTKDLGSCSMVYDQWYRTVFSAQWCYHIGRVHGNVKYPSGGYTKAVVEAMKKYGAVPWDACLTPKTPACAPLTYPHDLGDLLPLALQHRIDGYAVVLTFEAVMDAIEQSPSHCVNMATNLEEDYLRPSPGNIWKAHPGQPKAGSHALPWVFVDRAKGLIGCWNSWGNTDYPQTCWVDKKFWAENCSPGYVALDKDEVRIGKDIYIRATLSSNVPAKFLVSDGEKETEYSGSPVLSLERGKPYKITAHPIALGEVEELYLEKSVCYFDEPRDQSIVFTFTKKTPSDPGNPGTPGTTPDWVADLFRRVGEILKKLLKRDGNDPGDPGEPSGRMMKG